MGAWLWSSSEAVDEVLPAFVDALQAADDITKSRTADIKTKAGQMRYTFADLADTLDAIKPVLTANDLAVTQAAGNDGVTTVVLHGSGQWIAFPPLTVATAQNTPQAHGSAITYARRYAVLAALGIATEDDDGRAAAIPQQAPVPLASSSQLKAIGTQLRALVGDDRDAGLAFIAKEAGRTVASSKELTTQEAAKVLAALKDATPAEPGPEQ